MKPTTQERIDRILDAITVNSTTEARRVIIEIALRQQDEETRHACAEAVMAIGGDDSLAGVSGRIVLNAFKDTAHKVIMNTQSI